MRECQPVTARVGVSACWFDGPYPLARLSIAVDNTTDWRAAEVVAPPSAGVVSPPSAGGDQRPPTAGRDEVIRRSLVAVHTLVAADDGRFVSLLDPPGSPSRRWLVCAGRARSPC